jgi:hypothetical protein
MGVGSWMEGNGGETAVELKGVVGGKIAKTTFESHEPRESRESE